MTYGETDRLTGGSCSASSEYNPSSSCEKAVDGDAVNTWWASENTLGMPQWWKYDFGVGVSWAIGKLIAYPSSTIGPNAFKVEGSNNDSDWDELYSGNMANGLGPQEFTWDNTTAYRYIRVYVTSVFGASSYVVIRELEAMEQLPAGGFWFIFCEAWEKHNKLWRPKLAIPKLGYEI